MLEWFLSQNLHRPSSPPFELEVQRVEIVDVLIAGEAGEIINENRSDRRSTHSNGLHHSRPTAAICHSLNPEGSSCSTSSVAFTSAPQSSSLIPHSGHGRASRRHKESKIPRRSGGKFGKPIVTRVPPAYFTLSGLRLTFEPWRRFPAGWTRASLAHANRNFHHAQARRNPSHGPQPRQIIADVRRGHQVLDSIHSSKNRDLHPRHLDAALAPPYRPPWYYSSYPVFAP